MRKVAFDGLLRDGCHGYDVGTSCGLIPRRDFQQLGVKRSARPICVKKLAIRGFLGAGSKSLSVMLPVNLALLRLAVSIQSCPTISPFDRCATAQDSDLWQATRGASAVDEDNRAKQVVERRIPPEAKTGCGRVCLQQV